jgi:Rod binding domain-containing protein
MPSPTPIPGLVQPPMMGPADSPFGGVPSADALQSRQDSFREVLGRAMGTGPADTLERARGAARQFIADTFILPILKQLRQSDRTPAPFGATQGEKQFRALMDTELAQRIAQAQRFPLVEQVARNLLKRAGKQAPDQETRAPFGQPPAAAPR